MLRVFLRFCGLLALAAGFAALVVDGTRSIAANSLAFARLGDTVAWVAAKKYEMIEPTVEKLHPYLWNPLLLRMFDIPTWVVFCGLGLLLLALGRPRAPRIGFSSRP